MNRFWRYKYRDGTTRWYYYLIPDLSGFDDYGRKTMVIHIPFFGFLVWAIWTCRCEDCEQARYLAMYEEELRDAAT